MARKKVVRVLVCAQAVDEQGTPTGPVEMTQVDTLDRNHDYRVCSVFWDDRTIENLWAPFYKDNAAREFPARVNPNSPLTTGNEALDAREPLTPEGLLKWWSSNEDHYVLCKGANCQPDNPSATVAPEEAPRVVEAEAA